MAIEAVMLDLGGVVLDSPLDVFAAFERKRGLPQHFLNRLVVEGGREGPWARFERGELPLEALYDAFDAQAEARGHAIDTRALMQAIADGTPIRARVVQAIDQLREAGYRMAALTNNWASDDQHGKMAELRQHFHVFVESYMVGMRKPDPRIYTHTCALLQVPPERILFLDDIGPNLKSARAMGIRTVKVRSEAEVLSELEPLLSVRG